MVFANEQKIIPLGSNIYDFIDALSLETGKSILTKDRPYSEAQVLSIINQIDKSYLSKPGLLALENIQKSLKKKPLYTEKNFATDISGSFALEGYLHTAENESMWLYNFNERLPILKLTAELWATDYFYALIEPDLKEDRFLITNKDDEGEYIRNFTNIPTSFGDFNYHFPTRGFVSLGGENWNIHLGRDRMESGNGETGKLLLSTYPDYYDFFKARLFYKNFAFTYSYINLESWEDSDPKQRFIADHAMQVRLFKDKLTLSINESGLYYGEAPELQFISPLIIYHNLIRNSPIDETVVNICMTTGFDYVPIKGLSFYGEYLLDEISTFLEQAEYSNASSVPNANAFLLGVKASYPVGIGYLSGFFEYTYTSPWCYLLDPEGGAMIWTHRDSNDVTNSRKNVKKYLGYEYGPDTMVWAGEAAYNMIGVFKAGLSLDYILKGENGYNSEYAQTVENSQMKTPTGTPEHRIIFGIFGTYKPFDFMSIKIDSAFLSINNFEHIETKTFFDFQNAISVVFDFSKKIFVKNSSANMER